MHVTGPCKHSEVENLRRVFEALDKDGTGSVKFDIFLRKSGMKPEVAKGFVHQAAREGVNEDITFPRLVKILYPKLAPYYKTYQPPINRKLALQKAQREEAAAAAAKGVLRKVEDLLNSNEISELRELFRILNKDGGGLLSTKAVVEAFKKNGLCGEDELMSMLVYRESQKEFLTEDQFVSIIGQYYPTVTLQEFIQESIKTFEEQREIKSRQRRRQALLAKKPAGGSSEGTRGLDGMEASAGRHADESGTLAAAAARHVSHHSPSANSAVLRPSESPAPLDLSLAPPPSPPASETHSNPGVSRRAVEQHEPQ